jgi:hypothetical protein
MRNKILIAALVVVGLASVAYAAFSQILTINGTGTATGSWDVKIISITPTAQTGATDHASTPSFTATSATFNVDLAYPGATSSYDVAIKNNGSIPAKLSSLTDLTTVNATAPTDLTYAVSGVAVNDTLAAGATVTATVTVTWNAAGTSNIATQSKAATITFNYVQN